jgi:hypothetical protein
VARTKKLLEERYQPMLKAAKVSCIVLEKKNEPGEPGVRLATMHRVKGLARIAHRVFRLRSAGELGRR